MYIIQNQINPDGNCLYRSIADQLFQDENKYQIIKRGAIEWLENNKSLFRPFLDHQLMSITIKCLEIMSGETILC